MMLLSLRTDLHMHIADTEKLLQMNIMSPRGAVYVSLHVPNYGNAILLCNYLIHLIC